MYTEEDRIIALAGIYQAAYLAQRTARHSMTEAGPTETCINSLFKIDSDTVADIFGGISGVAVGLRQFCRQLEGSTSRNMELTRYAIQLIQLERKLAGDKARLERIGQHIKNAAARLSHFPPLHANIVAQLADIYVENISNLQPRIMVRGEPLHLQNQDNVNRIRALLLAGIRAAMLWRQVGGKRRHVFFRRKKLLDITRQLLLGVETNTIPTGR